MPGVALGERVERAGQPDESVGLLVQRLVRRPIGRDHAVAQRLEVALQVGQRRAQLVGGVGDEVAAHLLLPLEQAAIWLNESARLASSSGPSRGTRAA